MTFRHFHHNVWKNNTCNDKTLYLQAYSEVLKTEDIEEKGRKRIGTKRSKATTKQKFQEIT